MNALAVITVNPYRPMIPMVADALTSPKSKNAYSRSNTDFLSWCHAEMFFRTLRALRDLRRWNTNVNVAKGAQVNIASEQTNINKAKGKKKKSKPKSRTKTIDA